MAFSIIFDVNFNHITYIFAPHLVQVHVHGMTQEDTESNFKALQLQPHFEMLQFLPSPS